MSSSPFLYHPLKHHLSYIHQFILEYDDTLENLYPNLIRIGASVMDVYTGNISIQQLFDLTEKQLKENDCFTPTAFEDWISKNEGYNIITLPDQSVWTLRWGTVVRQYIHIHPGRNSPHTFRIKGETLKTIIAAKIVEKSTKEKVSLTTINTVRKDYLKLSPIKKLYTGKGIDKMMGYFN